MASIHIVDPIDNLRKLKDSTLAHEWECGSCLVGTDAAEKLIGADLYVHESPFRPSRFGGTITGFRIHSGGESDGKVIFRFQASNDHRDVKTARAGWKSDMKIIW